MKLKYKLSLPSIIQSVIILLLIIFLAIRGNSILNTLEKRNESVNAATDHVYSIINNTDRYFLNEIDQQAVESSLNQAVRDMKRQNVFDTSTLVSEIQDINEMLKNADEISNKNNSIVNQIMELTNHSIEQSTKYIEGSVANLVDPEKRRNVTDIERLVIIGASNNNTANLKIQTLVYQMLRDFSKKDELLTFLDKGIENASQDVERLKDTPFAELPVAAVEANKTIKQLALTYVNNVETSNQLRETIKSRTENMLSELKKVSKNSIDNTFDEIWGLGILLIVVLIGLSAVLTVIGLVITRMIISLLFELKSLVATVVEKGDFSVRLETKQSDEVGDIVRSFNLLVSSINKAVTEINTVMEHVSTGDFTVHVESEQRGDLERLKNSINNSIDLLGMTIGNVRETSEQVEIGTQQLSQSAQALASGATEQAASIEEISSTTNIIGSQTKSNAENADLARQITAETLSVVESGNRKMEEMLASMKKINTTSTNVSKVIKAIDEIAFQTNLLALNAAVEAARAGKYGKGFAVVAEEVRNLASRSAEAAKNTTELIETSIKEVESGVTNSDQAAEALAEITNSVAKINDLVDEIAAASQEQTSGIDEINKGLNQINSVVQQNSSISEETASSSDELTAQATELKNQIARFKLKHGMAPSAADEKAVSEMLFLEES